MITQNRQKSNAKKMCIVIKPILYDYVHHCIGRIQWFVLSNHLYSVLLSPALDMADKIGNFEVGKEFDALIVDMCSFDSMVDIFPDETIEDYVEKYLFTGKLITQTIHTAT